uniref:Uncharacterized protein n=1 Tax=Anguilla anguilla TaxID=7936 RepID=A0A0E9X7I1_ANGAN
MTFQALVLTHGGHFGVPSEELTVQLLAPDMIISDVDISFVNLQSVQPSTSFETFKNTSITRSVFKDTVSTDCGRLMMQDSL